MYLKDADRKANSVDLAVWSESMLFAYACLSENRIITVYYSSVIFMLKFFFLADESYQYSYIFWK